MRISYLIFWVGIICTILSLVLFFLDFDSWAWGFLTDGYFIAWLDEVIREWHYYKEINPLTSWFGYFGLFLVAIGWLTSYGYNITIARIVAWVRKGDV